MICYEARWVTVSYLLLMGILLIGLPQKAEGFFLSNGDFETECLAGWSTYETPNGTLGGKDFPDCVDFDIRDDGNVTKSAVFKVGQLHYESKGMVLAGGGIYKNVQLNAGQFVVRADVATVYSSPKDRRNLAGGLFELLIDGEVIARHDFGPVQNNMTRRQTLEGMAQVSSGRHEVRVRIRRPFKSVPHDHAPRQYLDNVQFSLDAR